MTGMAPENTRMSRAASVLVGAVVSLAGAAILALAVFGRPEKFSSPRWVVACAGAAFLVFGGWTAALFLRGYDASRPNENLPSPRIQLMVLIPGLLFFAAPFHWIAFGPGPRQFSSTVSIPFVSVRQGAAVSTGRILFGAGALLIDAILVAAAIRLLRGSERGHKQNLRGPRADTPSPRSGRG